RQLWRAGRPEPGRAVDRFAAGCARRHWHWRVEGRGERPDAWRRGEHARGPGSRRRQRARVGLRSHRSLRRRKQRVLDVTLVELSTDQKTEALLDAFPYICEFVGKTVVVKVGGSVGDEGV